MAVGGEVASSTEDTPVVVAPVSDGSTFVAWTDSAAQSVRTAWLDAADRLSRAGSAVPGLQAHAALATSGGVALAVVADDPDIYSPKYCRGASTPNLNVCGKMDLVRLDGQGNPLSRTTLTEKGNVDSVGARFIWWYGHTARLATDGQRIGVYFRSATSTARPGVAGEVDIHAGDTLKFVDASTGALASGGWDWGCSHSWSVRLAHDGTQWGAACHGDAYPNAMRVSRLASPTAAPDSLQWLSNSDPTQRALGGLVPASEGFWLNYVEASGSALALKLARVPRTGAALTQARTITAAKGLDSAYPFRPYMAAYGNGRLLLGWKSGGSLTLAVADRSTGEIVDGPVTTTLGIDNFQEMTSASNGDVLWAHARGNTLSVNRVASCRMTP